MAFTSKRLFDADPSLISAIAENVKKSLECEGYSIALLPIVTGGVMLDLTKGGLFKAVLGLKTALKVTLRPEKKSIYAEASVGIFGQQLIPTVIMLFFAWPVLLTQIWGMIKQAKLDDHVMDLLETAIANLNVEAVAREQRGCFCPECGARTMSDVCAVCGTKLV